MSVKQTARPVSYNLKNEQSFLHWCKGDFKHVLKTSIHHYRATNNTLIIFAFLLVIDVNKYSHGCVL